MPYTDAERIRRHFAVERPTLDRVTDQPLVLAGTDEISFYGGPVEPASLVVKSPQAVRPSRQTVTLAAGAVAFASVPVVRGSVLAASDTSLGTLYQENLDYHIDYRNATVTVKPGGALAAGQSVTLWFRPFHVYQPGADYALDAARGCLRRLAGGAVADGETVLLDYTPLTAGVTDEMIDEAVVVANGLVERQVDPAHQYTADPGLSAAATFTALDILCRAAAARELAARPAQDRAALAWLKLAAEYADRASRLLAAFRPPFDSPAAPVHG